MPLSNVVIKYSSDDSDLIKIEKRFQSITQEERNAQRALQDVDKEAAKLANTTARTADQIKSEYADIKSVIKNVFDVTQLKAYNQQLDALEKEARQAGVALEEAGKKSRNGIEGSTKSMGGLQSMVKSVGPSILAAFSVGAVIAFGKQVIETSARFEKLEAVLTNTLGSKSAAQKALSDIEQFAAQTNFGVAELTEGFVKLANQGFVPTTGELTKLADLANSTGKTFDQLVEGIIDAQTGEFERLKEFGIRASKEGDKVSFTFKGVKTQVDFTEESIRKYVLGLGDLQGVSGATAAISGTLGGKISNLGDAFDGLLKVIGTRMSDFLKTSISLATQLADALKVALTPQADLDKAAQLNKIKAEELHIQNQVNALVQKVRFDTGDRISNEQAQQALLNQEYEKNATIFDKITKQQQFLRSINQTTGEGQRTKAQIDADLKSLAISDERIRVLQNLVFGTEAANKSIDKQRGLLEKLKAELDAINKKKPTLTDEDDIREANIAAKKLQLEIDRLNKLGIEEEKAAKAAREKQLKVDQDYYDKRIALVQQAFRDENALNDFYNDQAVKDAEDRISLQQSQSDELLELNKTSNKGLADINRKDGVALAKQVLDNTKYSAEQRLYIIKSNEDKQIELIDKRVEAEKRAAQDSYAVAMEQGDNSQLVQAKFDQELTDIEKKGDADRLAAKRKAAKDELGVEKELSQAEIDLRDQKRKKIQEIEQAAVTTIQGLGSAYFQYQSDQRNAQLSRIQTAYNTELKLAGDNDQQKQAISNRYQIEQLKLKRKEAQANKNQALFDIGINTAVGVSKALPNPYLVALTLALGLAQAAVVAARPLPQYNKGTKYVKGVDVGNRDSVTASLTVGEAVIPREANKKYKPIINGIIDGTLDPGALDFILNKKGIDNKITVINNNKELLESNKRIEKAIASQQRVSLEMDENGFNKYLLKSASRTQVLNNYYKKG
jgi:hypothetical protein